MGRVFQKNNNTLPERGWGWEITLFADIRKKCEDENDADGIKTYFAIDFGIIFGNFRAVLRKWEGGLGSRRILFLYRIQPPIFPIGVALFFHMALFFHVGVGGMGH